MPTWTAWSAGYTPDIRDVNKDSGFKAKARTKDLSIFNTKDRTKDFCL